MRRVVGFDTLNNDNGGTGPKQVGRAVSPPADPVVDGECCVSGGRWRAAGARLSLPVHKQTLTLSWPHHGAFSCEVTTADGTPLAEAVGLARRLAGFRAACV